MPDLEPLNAGLMGKELRLQVEQRRDAPVVRGSTFPDPDGSRWRMAQPELARPQHGRTLPSGVDHSSAVRTPMRWRAMWRYQSNRHFSVLPPPRPLEVIDAELKQVTDRILEMISGPNGAGKTTFARE